jgi:hypothetical protein
MRGENHKFRKNGSEIFLRGGLDRANQVEMAGENWGFGAADFDTLHSPIAWNLARR